MSFQLLCLVTAETIQVSLICCIGLVSFIGWSRGIARLSRGQPLLEKVPRSVPRWSFWEVIGLGLLFYCVSPICTSYVCVIWNGSPLAVDSLDKLTGAQLCGWMAAHAFTSLIALVMGVIWLRLRRETSWRDLGIETAGWWRDLKLGGIAFAMLSVPVFAVNALMLHCFPNPEHLAFDLMRDANAAHRLTIVLLATVVVAPLVEEFLFRGLMQSWLQVSFDLLRELPAGDSSLETLNDQAVGYGDERLENEEPESTIHQIPRDCHENGWVESHDSGARCSYGAIVITSLTFASMHFTQWPAPVALFVLSLGLGYLYDRTGRLLPCIVVHALLNATTVLGLWIMPPEV